MQYNSAKLHKYRYFLFVIIGKHEHCKVYNKYGDLKKNLMKIYIAFPEICDFVFPVVFITILSLFMIADKMV